MEITDVRVFPVEEDKLKAFVSIIIDDCFVVSDIKIINGSNGLFISMPSKKRKNGTFRDIAHPLNNETRKKIEDKVLARYREVISHGGGAPRRRPLGGRSTPLRRASPAPSGPPHSTRTIPSLPKTGPSREPTVGASSSGKTLDFGSRTGGSNPPAPTTGRKRHRRAGQR